MAVQATPSFIQAGSEAAEDVRRLIHSLIGERSGIVGFGDLLVSANGTPNMSVNVASGSAFIAGTEGTYQGVYHLQNRGTLNLAIATADPTNARRDLVIARIRDQAYSGVANTAAIEVVTGTAAASPADPTVPANSLVLARVTVSAGVTSITSGPIADVRWSYLQSATNVLQQTVAAGLRGVIPCLSTARPNLNVPVSQVIYQTDTREFYVNEGVGVWTMLTSIPTNWVAPTLLNSWVNYGAGNVDAAYRKIGDIVYLRGQVKNGTTTAGTSILTLPVGYRPLAQVVVPTIDGNNALGRFDITTAGAVIIQVGANNAFGITCSFATT